MDEKIKATLTNLDTWKRGLFMVFFSIISGLAKFIVSVVAVFQFITLLFKGQVNSAVLPFGQNLSTYLYQINLFLTFKTDEMPFPFLTFPDGAPESILNERKEEETASSEVAAKNGELIADAADEDSKDARGAEKDTKE